MSIRDLYTDGVIKQFPSTAGASEGQILSLEEANGALRYTWQETALSGVVGTTNEIDVTTTSGIAVLSLADDIVLPVTSTLEINQFQVTQVAGDAVAKVQDTTTGIGGALTTLGLSALTSPTDYYYFPTTQPAAGEVIAATSTTQLGWASVVTQASSPVAIVFPNLQNNSTSPVGPVNIAAEFVVTGRCKTLNIDFGNLGQDIGCTYTGASPTNEFISGPVAWPANAQPINLLQGDAMLIGYVPFGAYEGQAFYTQSGLMGVLLVNNGATFSIELAIQTSFAEVDTSQPTNSIAAGATVTIANQYTISGTGGFNSYINLQGQTCFSYI